MTPTQTKAARKKSLISRLLPKRESKAFGSIEVYPRALRFRTQNPGEKVYILARAHIITNIGWIIRLLLLSMIPIVAFLFVDYFGVDFGFVTDEIVVLLVLGFYLSLTASLIMNLMSWYYDIYLVTSERILHYAYQPLASYKVLEAEIENIQEVTQATVGFAPSLFGYGDIIVRTAASRNKFYFRAVSRPVWFRDVIADLSRLIRTKEP